MFTGDRSGDWLFRALHKTGFANQPNSVSADDGLRLIDCAITATVHCAPPDNKPTLDEFEHCREWLDQIFDLLRPRVTIALGQLAFRAVLTQAKRLNWRSGPLPRFGHAEVVPLADERWLIASYHPSQQNTFTGKLTEAMFDKVFRQAKFARSGRHVMSESRAGERLRLHLRLHPLQRRASTTAKLIND